MWIRVWILAVESSPMFMIFFSFLFVMMMQSFETFESVAYLSILRVGVSWGDLKQMLVCKEFLSISSDDIHVCQQLLLFKWNISVFHWSRAQGAASPFLQFIQRAADRNINQNSHQVWLAPKIMVPGAKCALQNLLEFYCTNSAK